MLSIREAVEALSPTRDWLAMRRALPNLARDPTSRLAAIRDVVMYMLPNYLPDPRRGAAEIAALTTMEFANREAFFSRYRLPTGKMNGDKFFRHHDLGIAPQPGTTYLRIKFFERFMLVGIDIMGFDYIYVFDGRRRVAICEVARYRQHGWIECGKVHTEEDVWPLQFCSGGDILPCGVVLCQNFRDGLYSAYYSPDNGAGRLEIAPFDANKIYDDFGEKVSKPDQWCGASPSFARLAFFVTTDV